MRKKREKVVILSESDYDSICTLLHDVLCTLGKAEPSYLVGEASRKVGEALEFLKIEK